MCPQLALMILFLFLFLTLGWLYHVAQQHVSGSMVPLCTCPAERNENQEGQ